MLRCLAQLRKPIAFVLTRLNYSLLLILSTVALTMAQENALKVIKANNDLTTKLYAEINKPNENVFFSPLSIHTVLSLAYQGTKDKTENAFREVLGLEDKLKTADGYESIMSKLNHIENVTLEIANRVYVKDGYKLQPAFKDVAEKNFFAGAEPLDFAQSAAAAKSINDWVEQRTQNKIKDLISADDLNALTRLVLVNAIYFKGDWEHKFEETATTTEPFYTSETDSVDCRMMHKTRKYDYKEVPELDAKVLRIPYKNKDLSLVVVLPNKRTGITDLESKLSTFDLHKITEDMDYLEVELSLPKFKVETTMELNEPLKKMGLAQAFSDEADFSAMLESPEPLKISKVIQKAFIEVNEEGAEAAAATGLTLEFISNVVTSTVEFNVDHSFFVFLSVKCLNYCKCKVKRVLDIPSIMFFGAILMPSIDSTINEMSNEAVSLQTIGRSFFDDREPPVKSSKILITDEEGNEIIPSILGSDNEKPEIDESVIGKTETGIPLTEAESKTNVDPIKKSITIEEISNIQTLSSNLTEKSESNVRESNVEKGQRSSTGSDKGGKVEITESSIGFIDNLIDEIIESNFIDIRSEESNVVPVRNSIPKEPVESIDNGEVDKDAD